MRKVISKSAKRKMTSFVEFPINVDGKTELKKVIRHKANAFTEQVVYITEVAKGKFRSITKHERR